MSSALPKPTAEFTTILATDNYKVELWNGEALRGYNSVLIYLVSGVMANSLFYSKLTFFSQLNPPNQYIFTQNKVANIKANAIPGFFILYSGVKAKLSLINK